MRAIANHDSQGINRAVVLRAALFMVLSALCFSLIEISGEHLVKGVPPFEIVWLRYAVHLAFMLVVLAPRYKTTLVRTSRPGLQIVRSLTMLVMPVCFIFAATKMPVNDVWALQWLSPLIMLVLSHWILHEPANGRQWIVAGVGYAGMLLTLHVDRGIISPAGLLAVGTGVCLALHLTLSRVLRSDHPLTSLFHTALWVFIALGFVVPFSWVFPSKLSMLGLVIIGLVGALGLYALARSGELVPIPIVASFAYIEAFWTLLINAALFGILPGKSILAGTAIILVVTVYQLLSEYRRHTANPAILSPEFQT
jgi:drug/metabolite transporter (DMT)-like permease